MRITRRFDDHEIWKDHILKSYVQWWHDRDTDEKKTVSVLSVIKVRNRIAGRSHDEYDYDNISDETRDIITRARSWKYDFAHRNWRISKIRTYHFDDQIWFYILFFQWHFTICNYSYATFFGVLILLNIHEFLLDIWRAMITKSNFFFSTKTCVIRSRTQPHCWVLIRL